uniref:neuroblast differentiation-associated protein AHNAK n=1 Tax=Doryrhamphus excisus TaxID=161450 RepID=UPI0025AE30BA|nr:neuroblast differentiation-associated protein AHNAK [Doryrhamphus excisus]XP_057913167.1 neuroblast differentiation-associated protein AHNAK [Doryrhamphus excisus]
MTTEYSMNRFSENLVLDGSERGGVIKGMPGGVGNGAVQTGGDIVAATIRLDHLEQNEVLNILKVLQPYDNNLQVVTKNDANANDGIGSLGFNPAEVLGGDLMKKADLDNAAEKPVLSLDNLTGKLNEAQSFGGQLNNSVINDLPDVNLTKPSADAGAEFTLPGVAKAGTDLNGSFGAPAVNLASPHLNNLDASLDIGESVADTGNLKFKAPQFTMPRFDLPQIPTSELEGEVNFPSVRKENVDLNLSSPNIRSPDVDLNGPDVHFQAPNADLGVASDKIKWPHQKWKGPKLKGPEATLNADLHAPKLDGDLSAPGIHLPQGDIKGPDVDVQAPNLDLGAPSGKINWPHLKWKKPKTPDLDVSVPTVEGGLNTPDLDVNLPKADIKGPDLDTQPPAAKINWPHLKWKKPKVKGPKADLDIDAGLNTPSLEPPHLQNDVNAQLDIPTVDVKGLNLNGETPNLDMGAPSGKFNWPHWKLKKPKLPEAKVDMDLNADLNTPDVDVSAPRFEGGINTPDLNLPDVDVKTPDVDIGAPSGKVKFPTLRKFLFSGPKLKTPSVDLDTDVKTPDLGLSAPQVQLNGPDVNLPKTDINAKAPDVDASGKIKWPTLKKPRWSVSGPKVNGPDIDPPDLNLAGPRIDGEFNTPDVKLDGPKLDVDGKLKWPKKPKFGTLKGGTPDIDADVKLPNVDLNAPNIDAPDLNLKSPNVDLQGPDLNFEPSDAKVKIPKLKVPKWPKVKGPQVDTGIDMDGPDVDLKAPGLQASLDTPDVDLGLPKAGLQTPDLDVSTKKPKFPKLHLPTFSGPKIEKPNLDLDADLKTPGVDLSPPHVGVSTPKFEAPDLRGPSVDLHTPDLKFPTFSAPKLEKPNMDVDGDVKVPNVDLSGPRVGLKGPDSQFKTPDLDFDSRQGDFMLPHYKLPKLDLSRSGELEAPRVNIGSPRADANISAPAVDAVNGPMLKGSLKGPTVDMTGPKVDADLEKPKLPHFKLPKMSFSGSKTKTPELDASPKLSPVDVSAPEINTPEVAIKAGGDADVRASPKSKLKWPFKWGLKSSSDADDEGANAETDAPVFRLHNLPRNCIEQKMGAGLPDTFSLSRLDSEDKDYVVSKGIRLPVVNVPLRNGEKIDIMERLKMAKEKAPSSNTSPTEEKNIALKTPDEANLFRGGTFKVDKPASPLGLFAPEISSSDENEKLSLGLSNMLGLNVNDVQC